MRKKKEEEKERKNERPEISAGSMSLPPISLAQPCQSWRDIFRPGLRRKEREKKERERRERRERERERRETQREKWGENRE